MIYWTLKEVLGFSFGTSENREDIPRGAEAFETEEEMKEAVDSLEKETEKEIEDFFINEPERIEKELEKELEDKGNNGVGNLRG